MADTPSELLQKAVAAYGQDYLDVEKQLRSGGESTATALKQLAADGAQPPLAQFIAATIAAWIDGKGDNYDVAINGLAGLAARAEQTPRGAPAADVAAGRLARFDDISDFVALRMLKETAWPDWQVLAAIVYLGYWATSSVLPALDQFRDDLKSGKRAALGSVVTDQTQDVMEKLDEAAQLVRIVIENETFKSELDKVKQSEGDKTAQTEAAKLAIAQAVSSLYAQPANAQKIDQAVEAIRAALVSPVLQATEGVLNPEFVRGVLAGYILGEESASAPTPAPAPTGAPGTGPQPESD